MSAQGSRYGRQQLVKQFGEQSQAALKGACVLVIGAGGLGSPLCLFLAGAGVGSLILVDHDVVSLSNLHRQILFQEDDIGELKVNAAKERLSALNSDIKIDVLAQPLTSDNASDLVKRATVVVDAADNFLVSYLLSDVCLVARIPLVTASVLTTHGYLGVFCGTAKQTAPSLRAVFPSPSKTAGNCSTAGVTGPSVGVISSYQAQEVLKVILDDENQLLGKLMYLDLWSYSQNIIDFSAAEEPARFAPIISNNEVGLNDVLLDVRSEAEVAQSPSNKTALNIPDSELLENLNRLVGAHAIVCFCASGQRALRSANLLISNGFANVSVISISSL